MPSAAVRLRDLRAVYELTHECRDLGDDPIAWRKHWFSKIAALVGADLALGGELTGLKAGTPRELGTADWGWDNGFNRAGWRRALELMKTDPAYSPMLLECGVRLQSQDGVALSATDFVDERQWLRGIEYQEVYRPIGVHHSLWCCKCVPGKTNETNGAFFCRAAGRRNFNDREKAILAEAHSTIMAFVGGALTRFDAPSPVDLAPRVRGVLRCLLEGDSDKQVAARLGISKYTVNQYVKVIFTHFGVTTRAELLARWIRRGWGTGFAWANDDGHAPK
ncbi:family transcriptional regulator : LuxR family transcriptional regulator OS=Myxococcus stipitatus (strain DSM 14675 / JCM 12634 / Mx s8) GN=MYSTI_02013 PE=4 SV=1: GerE [Gemmata massiliana]|uniref:HTH luxR-type domain-containing protein n=1 Tax=Gemmata massiliana TaxID=1210884 RepID=A0A6P2CWH9_9BACT|nr:helix-turn-helix transcriptional regulator [Gemmata massiliana]VTR91520.1 family transcriptional regulator : LuxR family transcriptional regulator OS=Myxococcus stipitatus (strain DSM 14675 / JCM 12634 / Mx s8) GN=MYSTI_02013 PE=4 SV=1: GerE [Gemmata massiliana]